MIEWRQYLISDPQICHGELCAQRNPRVVLDSWQKGREDILQSYPSLALEHIDAAIAYAAELAHEESLLPLRSA